MYVLYELGILLAQFLKQRKIEDKAQAETAQTGE
jgi:Sec-independent protein secretion pathway component TatC